MTTTRTPNALRCYVCIRNGDPGTNLKIGDDVVKRKRARRHDEQSKTYDHVPINCLDCGHQWFSMHPDAVAKSRKLDRNLARRHGGQK